MSVRQETSSKKTLRTPKTYEEEPSAYVTLSLAIQRQWERDFKPPTRKPKFE